MATPATRARPAILATLAPHQLTSRWPLACQPASRFISQAEDFSTRKDDSVALQIASLSIAARSTLDMHSLNNEGGEGNQIQTRMVDIVGGDGHMHNVNAISGDMLKHIQAQHFFELARDQRLPLCAGCARFDANRINADKAFAEALPKSDPEALSALLRHCAMDDTAGILITAGNRSLPRKSVVEFGWVVGIPALVETDSYFHVKYAERGKERREADAAARDREGANLGQAIFHRPASSG